MVLKKEADFICFKFRYFFLKYVLQAYIVFFAAQDRLAQYRHKRIFIMTFIRLVWFSYLSVSQCRPCDDIGTLSRYHCREKTAKISYQKNLKILFFFNFYLKKQNISIFSLFLVDFEFLKNFFNFDLIRSFNLTAYFI
jgi:hypothetical protein